MNGQGGSQRYWIWASELPRCGRAAAASPIRWTRAEPRPCDMCTRPAGDGPPFVRSGEPNSTRVTSVPALQPAPSGLRSSSSTPAASETGVAQNRPPPLAPTPHHRRSDRPVPSPASYRTCVCRRFAPMPASPLQQFSRHHRAHFASPAPTPPTWLNCPRKVERAPPA